ncbi:MAG: elongation factor P, partial [Anaerolineaceae bacterium]|nr:elongation factor P [Anaerolineaceae bacterium]
DVNDLRKGVIFKLDDSLYRVLDYHHNKTGRGNASIRIKARNLRTNSTLEKTFSSGERVQDVRLDYHNMQYLYTDGDLYHFMDTETFEQLAITKSLIGDSVGFLKEGLEVKLTIYGSEPLDVELPTSVDLKVIQAEAAVRGDTATSVTKKVILETGQAVDVPNFVNTGDTVRIDTRSGAYLTRVTD